MITTKARLIEWFGGYCSDCADGSELFEDAEEAEVWIARHNRDNHEAGSDHE